MIPLHRTVWISLACLFVAHSDSPGQPQANRPPGGIVLLSDYRHERHVGIDSEIGEITKQAGPKIVYEIGAAKFDLAQLLLRESGVTLKAQTVRGHPFKVFLRTHNRLSIDFLDANFDAENVRTHNDVVDVLLMVMTYSPDR